MDMDNKGAVVITGASSGIGKACSLFLDQMGYRVFAGVRTSSAAEKLKTEASSRLVPVMLDITNTNQIQRAVQEIKTNLGISGRLVGLINNAGIILSGPLEFFPLERLREQLQVNVIGPIAVTQAFLSLIRKGKGRIINMGSASGLFVPPFLGPYAASKFAMEAWTDALRRELRPEGIPVSLIESGAIETPIWDKSQAVANSLEAALPDQGKTLYGNALATGRKQMENLRRRAASPLVVAKVVHKALISHHPKSRYLVGMDAHVQAFISRWVPARLVDDVIAKLLFRD
ncbi:MAG: SDR family oxidoreductase [Deltaproteobacteria bacterium]|nr:SDR family oxidoreductase [Deltaproteobacteria bacterium]